MGTALFFPERAAPVATVDPIQQPLINMPKTSWTGSLMLWSADHT